MNDSRDFKDAESVRSGHSHVASQPVSFSPHPVPGGMLSRSKGMPSRKNGPPSIWDTHGFWRNVFANPTAYSSAPCPQELNPWSSKKIRTHIRTCDEWEPNTSSGSEMPVRTVSQKFSHPWLGRFFKDLWSRSQIFISTNPPRQQHLLAGRFDSRPRYVLVHNFLWKACCGSKKWSWLIQWMI